MGALVFRFVACAGEPVRGAAVVVVDGFVFVQPPLSYALLALPLRLLRLLVAAILSGASEAFLHASGANPIHDWAQADLAEHPRHDYPFEVLRVPAPGLEPGTSAF